MPSHTTNFVFGKQILKVFLGAVVLLSAATAQTVNFENQDGFGEDLWNVAFNWDSQTLPNSSSIARIPPEAIPSGGARNS
jgi:hypothetical protein